MQACYYKLGVYSGRKIGYSHASFLGMCIKSLTFFNVFGLTNSTPGLKERITNIVKDLVKGCSLWYYLWK